MTSVDMTFAGLALPEDVAVYLSAETAESLEEVRRSSPGLFGASKSIVEVAVKTAEIDVDAYAPDARARAVLRGAKAAKETLRASGGAYSLEQVQALLNDISRQAVDKKVGEGALLAVPGPSNRRSYPTIQFDDRGALVEGLRDVVAALPTRNAWSILHFLVTPDSRLSGRKPIDLLKAGEIEPVVGAARRMGEQGA